MKQGTKRPMRICDTPRRFRSVSAAPRHHYFFGMGYRARRIQPPGTFDDGMVARVSWSATVILDGVPFHLPTQHALVTHFSDFRSVLRRD